MASDIKLTDIIDMLWFHPKNAEWKPKTDVISGAEFRRWMASDDIEVLGYAYHLLGDHRFRMAPELSLDAEKKFELLLANAQHIKCVPGRKTDQKDSEWIADLLPRGAGAAPETA